MKYLYLHSWMFVPIVFMVVAYSIIYLIEWKHPRLSLPHVHHSITNWLKGIGYIISNFVMAIVMASWLQFCAEHMSGLFMFGNVPYWLRFAFSFLFLDIVIYFWHRINHVYYPLWKLHEFHHEEKELNIFSTFHFHPKEVIISTAWRLILLPLMGILPESLIIYEAIFFTVILFHHSNFKMAYPWDKIAGAIIVTPGLHHIHHSVIKQESNSNYGSVFSFWDRLFGTVTAYKKQRIVYGVDAEEKV